MTENICLGGNISALGV